MQAREFYETLKVDKSPLETLAFNPYYRPMTGPQHGRRWIEGQPYFDLASNDYLGLSSDWRIQEAMVAAVREYGSSMCGTPIATGYARILSQLEHELSRFVGLEAALVFPSCYQANVALFPCIATPQDGIIVDHYAHASLVHGIRSVGCKVKPFLHNDMEHLESQLAASTGFRQIFVVTESVFSTEGSVAPLGVIQELCRRYNAIPVLDDSHGLGVLGRSGRGILEDKGITDYSGIYTASLGKALANTGGVIAGKRIFIEALRYSCPGLIYSTALPPASVAGALCALEVLLKDFGPLSSLMWRNHARLLETLKATGFLTHAASAPIAAVQCGSTSDTIRLAKLFFEGRILATPFVAPSVPEGKGVLRLILGAKLKGHSVDGVLSALGKIETHRPEPRSPASLRT